LIQSLIGGRCADYWHDSYEGAPTDTQTWTKDVQKNYEAPEISKSIRGGSWNIGAYSCRSASRVRYDSDDLSSDLGFRVVI
jgi:formylglycine-generating enzyme required for sulfatase activity